MNPHFHTDFSISDSLIFVRKSVLIYETIIILTAMNQEVIENLESIADGYLDVIVTMNYNIDIISEEEPEIEIKS